MPELIPIFNGVARTFAAHRHGRRKKGRNLKISAKTVLLVQVVKTISPLLAPLEKLLEISTSAPLEKFLPMSMHTSM